jgi:membrane-anchored mycosin MYCP
VWASEHGADVIVIAAPVGKDDDAVRLAVTEAGKRGAVVVAAVGDQGGTNGTNPTPYPADYPGVLGVGAIGSTGQVWENSQKGDYVDLVAPGEAVPTVQRGSGLVEGHGDRGRLCGRGGRPDACRKRRPARLRHHQGAGGDGQPGAAR